jgi:uncharacterized protein (TIGR02145 family)
MKKSIVNRPQTTVKSKKWLVTMIALLYTINYSLFTNYSYSQTAINTTGALPANSAMLDVSSTNLGVLINRMNDGQMRSITPGANAQGLMVFNVTDNCFYAYVNSTWNKVACPANCTPISTAPTPSGASNTDCNRFTAGWSTVSGASSYYMDVSTDATFSSTFVNGFQNLNVGNATSFTVSGLAANTSYYYRVRASSGPGCISTSSSTTLAYTNCFTCGGTLTVNTTAGNIAPISTTLHIPTVLTNYTGTNECWITQNLGATSDAASLTDASDAAAGWYWLFGQKQGYYVNGSTLTPSISTFEANINVSDPTGVTNWNANDPCKLLLGSGWRMPTNTEWVNVVANTGWTTAAQGFSSDLKLYLAGYVSQDRQYIYDSQLGDYVHPPYIPDQTRIPGGRGTLGFLWSSTYYGPIQNLLRGDYFYMDMNGPTHIFQTGAQGFNIAHPVRCLLDQSTCTLDAPVQNSTGVYSSQINWKWSPVANATAYLINTTSNDYNTATNIGSNPSYFQKGLTCNTPYTLYVWAISTNGCTPSSAIFTQTTTANCVTCPSTVSDGTNTYSTVLIGDQCWIAQNFNFTTGAFNDNYGARDCYNGFFTPNSNCATYGGLYSWGAAMRSSSTSYTSCDGDITHPACTTPAQGICPTGWHIPSKQEFILLLNTATSNGQSGQNSDNGGNLKEAGYTHWQSPNTGATNNTGFTALGAGYFNNATPYSSLNSVDYIWTSTLVNPGNPVNSDAYILETNYAYKYAQIAQASRTAPYRVSVRCLKD